MDTHGVEDTNVDYVGSNKPYANLESALEKAEALDDDL
jgi:hypothetical protein